MKKNFCLMFFCLLVFNAFGQERENRKKLEIDLKSDIISKTTLWSYSKLSGEWKGTKTKDVPKLQFYSILLDTARIFILRTETVTGVYEYPNIKEGWHLLNMKYAYIFSEKEYNKLYSSDSLAELKTNHKIFISDEQKYLGDYVQQELLNKYAGSEYTFPVFRYKDVVRFLLPDSYNDRKDFDTFYFEVSKKDFEKLIFIKK